jgi:uncharacterized protein YjeT (DUF2065 family)
MLTIALVFVFVGIVLILCGNQLSETLNTFSEKNIKEAAKFLGDQSIPKSEISTSFLRLIGVVIIISAIVGIFFINMLQQGN